MKQRKWTTEEKLAILMEGFRGQRSVVEICREHQISQSQYYKWRDKFLEGGKRALSNGVSDENIYKAEIEKLQKIADTFDEQVDVLVDSMMSLLEPIMVLGLGGIVMDDTYFGYKRNN
jgi:transposase-like protein